METKDKIFDKNLDKNLETKLDMCFWKHIHNDNTAGKGTSFVKEDLAYIKCYKCNGYNNRCNSYTKETNNYIGDIK